MNYWPRWIGSIQKKTSHLSLAEMGAYDRLLDYYYAQERPLPADIDRCCRIAGAATKDERKAVECVLAEFFTLGPNGHEQERAAQEIAEAQPKLAAARTNGAKGGRPKGTKDEPSGKPSGLAGGLPDGTQSESSTPSDTETIKPPIPRKRGTVCGFPAGFEAFWAAFPRKTAKDKATQAFAKLQPDEALQAVILAAVKAQCTWEQWTKDGGQFVPHAATWINGKRWEDQAAGSPAKQDRFAGAM